MVDKPCESASPDWACALRDPEKSEKRTCFFALGRGFELAGLLAENVLDAVFRFEAFFFADFFGIDFFRVVFRGVRFFGLGFAVRAFFLGVFLAFLLAAITPKFITRPERDEGRLPMAAWPSHNFSGQFIHTMAGATITRTLRYGRF
jgi:hypothetical protein